MTAPVRSGTAGRLVVCGLLLGVLLGHANPAVASAAAAVAPRGTDRGPGLPTAPPPPLRAASCELPVARPEPTTTHTTSGSQFAGVRELRDRGSSSPQLCHAPGPMTSAWVVVNKSRPLSPLTYVPAGLVSPRVPHAQGQRMRSDAAAAVVSMFRDAETAGAGAMAIASGYRSHTTQHSVHRHRVSTSGRAHADAWIARPGYSEHQTGLTLDIAPFGSSTCSTPSCLGSTTQGRWLLGNAWRHGFLVRYEPGYTGITGYNPEPWHFRYVGAAVAADYHAGGWHTLEQYFGLAPAPTY